MEVKLEIEAFCQACTTKLEGENTGTALLIKPCVGWVERAVKEALRLVDQSDKKGGE